MTTIVHVLAEHARRRPEALFVRFVDADDQVAELTFGACWAEARRWAESLLSSGLQPGGPVLLALPNEPDLVTAYFGTLIAAGVPAPVAPVLRAAPEDPRLRALAERVRSLGARQVILPRAAHDVAAALGPLVPAGTRILDGTRLADAAQSSSAPAFEPLRAAPDDLGLIQFSSGTAGAARAVELTHRSLLEQTRILDRVLDIDRETDSAVSWLPLFHDMGLVGFLLTPAYVGAPVTILRTEAFLRNPRVWLRAITRFRPTITGGPPSAYALCARFAREAERGDHQLDSLRVALVGAEMIEPAAMRAFAAAMRPSGFRAECLVPSYGLAENGLAVTTTRVGAGLEVDVVDPVALSDELSARPPRGTSRREIASVGRPVPGAEVVIADASGRHLADRSVGQVLVRSTTLMRGYRGGSDGAIRDGWLWTGDMGYVAEGRLHLTGRSKELIIVGGTNYFPEDLEAVAASVPGVRQGRAVAFSVETPALSTEAVVVLVETALREHEARVTLGQTVRRSLAAAGYPVHRVVPVPPRTIRSTDTGKLMRVDSRKRYEAGEFDGPG